MHTIEQLPRALHFSYPCLAEVCLVGMDAVGGVYGVLDGRRVGPKENMLTTQRISIFGDIYDELEFCSRK